MLEALTVANYRSLRSLVIPLGRLNVITGPNGSGKSNLYRALRLLAEMGTAFVAPRAVHCMHDVSGEARRANPLGPIGSRHSLRRALQPTASLWFRGEGSRQPPHLQAG